MTAPLALDEALAALAVAPAPPVDRETVPLATAANRVLAGDVTAPTAVPAFDNSAMDGYALRHADGCASATLPLLGRVTAGQAPAPLGKGAAARIFTGAPVPAGADTVVRQEDCDADRHRVTIRRLPRPGANIRRAGQEIGRGDTALPAGRRLRPPDIGLLAALGVPELPVRQRLRVAVLSTGAELLRPGDALAPGQIHDANQSLLLALFSGWGLAPEGVGIVSDDPSQLEDRLGALADRCDVIVATGGMSVGEEDHLRSVVSALGAVDAWRIAIKPGKPVAWGRVGTTPFLGLPGNPGAALVTAMILARPWLLRLQGARDEDPQPIAVPAGFAAGEDPRTVFRHCRLVNGRAMPYPNPSSAMLSGAAWADGLAVQIPETRIEPGRPLPFLPWGSLL